MAWTFKLGDDKKCWKGLTNFKDDACTTAQDDASKNMPATGVAEKFADKVYVKTCADKSIVVQVGDDETAAKAAAEVKVEFT